jgi:hypothetical protein
VQKSMHVLVESWQIVGVRAMPAGSRVKDRMLWCNSLLHPADTACWSLSRFCSFGESSCESAIPGPAASLGRQPTGRRPGHSQLPATLGSPAPLATRSALITCRGHACERPICAGHGNPRSCVRANSRSADEGIAVVEVVVLSPQRTASAMCAFTAIFLYRCARIATLFPALRMGSGLSVLPAVVL